MVRGLLRLGSAGCQPAAFGSLAECSFARSANSSAINKKATRKTTIRGKLPRTAGWQPALPKDGELT
jgi:hypothetical protein